MVEKKARTYRLRKDTIEWVNEFASENDVDKTDVVDRAIRVYAAKIAKGDWKDPKFQSAIDKRFEELL